MNVAVLTPSTGICRMGYAQSLARLVMYYANVRVYEDCDVQHLITDSIEGSGIAANYQQMVERYLSDDRIYWTHFLSLEDDMIFPADTIHRLAKHGKRIVAANYSTNKGHPQRFTARALGGGPLLTGRGSTGIEEAGRIPQGVTLVAREVYAALPKPWYATHMQDYYFSELAREHGFQLWVDHDLSKLVMHTGPHNYTYLDALGDEQQREVARGE